MTTAERELWRQYGFESRHLSLNADDATGRLDWDVPDERDHVAVRLRLREALRAFARLPDSRREIKALQVAGFSYDEIAEMRGLTWTRVNHLLAEANKALREEQGRVAKPPFQGSPRAARLDELEREPPQWLQRAIGRRPPVTGIVQPSSPGVARRSRSTTTDVGTGASSATNRLASARSNAMLRALSISPLRPSIARWKLGRGVVDANAEPGEFALLPALSDVASDDETDPMVRDGRLVALAAPARCYFLTSDLTDEQFEIASAMCLCSREIRAGRLDGPFTTELAERWARVYLERGGEARRGDPEKGWQAIARAGHRVPARLSRTGQGGRLAATGDVFIG